MRIEFAFYLVQTLLLGNAGKEIAEIRLDGNHWPGREMSRRAD
ncbi:MAG: hypothetical protein O3A00_09065 [Planctomycetota bacterium]|nr:hypothetical protein [Planctomycetota bacterium]